MNNNKDNLARKFPSIKAPVASAKENISKNITSFKNTSTKEKVEKIKVWGKPKFDKLIEWSDYFIKYISEKNYSTGNAPMDAARGPIVFGLWSIIIIFGIFGLWSVTAPISSAAVARGQIVVSSSKKTIQHLEGGIISEILVKEGDDVTEGQPLIKLNDTSAKARQEILLSQIRTLRATEARLMAERDGSPEIKFEDPRLQDMNDPEVAKIIASQKLFFETRTKSVQGQINVLNQKIEQLGKEISGLESQAKSSADQLRLINEEIVTVRNLLNKGQGLRPRLLQLQRAAAELEGNIGKYTSEIAKGRQTIIETELEIINVKNEKLTRVASDLKDAQTSIADTEERYRASQDILDRTVIVAPQAGKVNGLKYHTLGGVIAPGATVMDIIPQDEKMVVDAQIPIQDIDVVYKGLRAEVRLGAYQALYVPIIHGTVINVSADRFIDETTKIPFYTARIELDEKTIKSLTKKNIELYPGMGADVLIVTGHRTFMSYFFDPIRHASFSAFREE